MEKVEIISKQRNDLQYSVPIKCYSIGYRSNIKHLKSVYIELYVQNYALYNSTCNLNFCVTYMLQHLLLLFVASIIFTVFSV